MKRVKRIFLGADHGGFFLKQQMKEYLEQYGSQFNVVDTGAHTFVNGDDYPNYAFAVAKQVAITKHARGILFCASGEGMAIAANKVQGIRAVAADTVSLAKRSRIDNDANVLCLAGGTSRVSQKRTSFSKAKQLIGVLLKTPFSAQKRHVRRLAKIRAYEKRRMLCS